MPTDAPATPPPIQVLALAGIPEIRIRDDLGDIIGNAIQRTPGALPLTDTDVLVVTQKIVSKAEGAVIDLTGVVPGDEATEFAERYGKDARQVQVVLNEARRVVRMENGVLITETPHGFVCANGGVDASNVGPDSGSLVTLLPRDPDASAAVDPGGDQGAVRRRRARSSCPTRSGDPGAGASSTSRSACPGCCRSTTCAASPMPTAESCAAPSEPSPTSWPPPPNSPSARPPDNPSPSSEAPPSPAATAGSPTS